MMVREMKDEFIRDNSYFQKTSLEGKKLKKEKFSFHLIVYYIELIQLYKIRRALSVIFFSTLLKQRHECLPFYVQFFYIYEVENI